MLSRTKTHVTKIPFRRMRAKLFKGKRRLIALPVFANLPGAE